MWKRRDFCGGEGVLMVQNVATMSYSYLVLLCETLNISSAPTGAPPILFRL